MEVTGNSAQSGGGLFVADDTQGQEQCKFNADRTNMEVVCFIQGLSFNLLHDLNNYATLISFANNSNTDQTKGSDIFGGLLDRCAVNPSTYVPIYIHSGLDYIRTMSTFNGKDGMNMSKKELAEHISSYAVEVCFCSESETYNCTEMNKTFSVRRGGLFRLMVTAVDQVQNQLAGTVIAEFRNKNGHFKEQQAKKYIHSVCTELEYNVYSNKLDVVIDLYADGPCEDKGFSKRVLSVTFLPYTCPTGLQPSGSNQECICECATEIKTIANCSDDTITLLSSDWVGFVNTSTNNTGLLVHSCPFDYCLERPVNISLSVPNGADMQCAFNRSNLLCGECKDGLSLVLGSSNCMKCTNRHLALILPFAILGILLVALIQILNMTVAVGVINGLIFYANIVNAGQSVFFTEKEVLPLKIFTAWLNLDFGIETCFYDGMTSNAKVFLQLVFPSYLILLTVLIIILCECSQRFAALLANRNPVATLCTLILLSY